MIDEIRIRPSQAPNIGTAKFGVLSLKDDEAVPTVGLVTLDTATNEKAEHKVRPGQSFRVAGQTWQVAEVRYPVNARWEVVLRRLPDGVG